MLALMWVGGFCFGMVGTMILAALVQKHNPFKMPVIYAWLIVSGILTFIALHQ